MHDELYAVFKPDGADYDLTTYQVHCTNIANLIAAVYQTDPATTYKRAEKPPTLDVRVNHVVQLYLNHTDAFLIPGSSTG